MNDKAHPLVSVITATYNAAKWLPETVESILSQDYPNLEYLILDDGSTDNTQEVLGKYINDPRVILFRHNNMGEVRTINKGYKLCDGEFVTAISADDPLWNKWAISTMVEFARLYPDVLVFYPDFMLIDKDSKKIVECRTPEWDYGRLIGYRHCIPGPAAMMRREVFSQVGYRNPDPRLRYVADMDYWQRVGRVAQMKRVPFALATHRRHAEQLTIAGRGKDMVRQHWFLFQSFFADPFLRPDLRKLERKARANTYLTMAYVCNGNRLDMLRYALDAVLTHPKIFTEQIGPQLASRILGGMRLVRR